MIRVVYQNGAPPFPASDQHPDAVRYTVGPYVVDAIGPAPTLAEVTAFVTPAVVAPGPTIDDLVTVLKARDAGFDAALKARVASVAPK